MAKIDDNANEIHPALKFLLSEWRALKRVSFYVAVGIVTVPIAYFWKLHYEGVIQEKDAMIARIGEERDAANRKKDDLGREVDAFKMFRQPDMPLKKRGILLAKQINEFAKSWKDTDDMLTIERNVDAYLQRFGLRVQIIRDDLDQIGQHTDEFDKAVYSFARNYKDIHVIAAEVEKLSNKLSD